MSFKVNSPNVIYTEDSMVSTFEDVRVYVSAKPSEHVTGSAKPQVTVTPVKTRYTFKTDVRVPKLGLMLVGWGGNNGSTVTASLIANQLQMHWNTKEGVQSANYIGSLTQSSTLHLGVVPKPDGSEEDVWIPFRDILPMVRPNDIVIDGWDISALDLASAMKRAQVLDYDLQRQLFEHLQHFVPRKAAFDPDFVAANQADRADNVLPQTSLQQLVDQIRSDIRDFKSKSKVDKIIVLWTANTERFADIKIGLNDTADNLLRTIQTSQVNGAVAPSTLYAVASVLEGCSYINGSPQNTFVPGLIQLAERHQVFVGGDDFKSGQTKIKSVLMDFLVSAGLKPTSIVSYNHLGNNDGKNLDAPQQFRSKEISKSNVVDDMVASNPILYPNYTGNTISTTGKVANKSTHTTEKKPIDHCVVIKYIPSVGDSKRALGEYTSEIFMGGKNTIVMHNTCEDSLLATPIIFDLAILCEICERIKVRVEGAHSDSSAPSSERFRLEGADADGFHGFDTTLSLLSYLLKAPLVPNGSPVVNALFKQRAAIENVFRACIGLPPQSHMALHHRMPRPVFRQLCTTTSSSCVDVELESIKVNGHHHVANGYPVDVRCGPEH